MEPSEQHSPAQSAGRTEEPRRRSSRRSGSHRRPERTPQAYRVCDGITEGLLYAMVIFTPWAFGTTQTWSIWTMNIAAYALGGVWIAKLILRRKTGYFPPRWGSSESRRSGSADSEEENRRTEEESKNEEEKKKRRKRTNRTAGLTLVTRILAALTLLFLAYCLTSAVNARATYYPGTYQFQYHDNYISWLPHSYDSSSSWFAFWQYLALSLVFWSVRDWLLGKTRPERRSMIPEDRGSVAEREQLDPRTGSLASSSQGLSSGPRTYIPDRLRRLLWVLCVNGALLALICVVQRLDGTNNLLWLIEPRWNKSADSQFGPYAYRSNAAQYFNLAWPVCLGFWWMLRRRETHNRQRSTQRMGSSPHAVLLPCAVLMAAAPIISTSRGGALIAIGEMLGALSLLLIAERRKNKWFYLGVGALFTAILVFAGYLGWAKLEARFEHIFTDDLSGRIEIYENSGQMIKDYWVLGSGPKTFGALYQLYRASPTQEWHAYLHDDWQETLITFGIFGFSFLLLALLLVVLRWWLRGPGIPSHWLFPALVWLALVGCLLHAKFDFPFQIYSVLFLFLLLCTMSFSTTRPSRG